MEAKESHKNGLRGGLENHFGIRISLLWCVCVGVLVRIGLYNRSMKLILPCEVRMYVQRWVSRFG